MLSLHTASRFNWISGKKNLARKAPSLARPQEKQYLPQWTSPDVCLNVIIWSLFSETRPSRIHTAALDYLLGMIRERQALADCDLTSKYKLKSDCRPQTEELREHGRTAMRHAWPDVKHDVSAVPRNNTLRVHLWTVHCRQTNLLRCLLRTHMTARHEAVRGWTGVNIKSRLVAYPQRNVLANLQKKRHVKVKSFGRTTETKVLYYVTEIKWPNVRGREATRNSGFVSTRA